jgi:decaprenylphospho-beta-D-ribofuranose 2-oxidase
VVTPPQSTEVLLSGWGRYPVVRSRAQRPEKLTALRAATAAAAGSTLLARGLGRAYGDAALTATGATILMERLNRMLAFDETTGVLRCEAGVTIREILETFVPRGWFPPVTPGTKFVTMGGALACDVHGKNHHRDGSFSNFVPRFTLLTPSGALVQCSPEETPDLFWATAGGMGLTGIIVELDLRLKPITSAYIVCDSVKARHLDETMEVFDRLEEGSQYSVAWVDTLASGRALGRGIVMLGNHALAAELDEPARARMQRAGVATHLRVPFDLPAGLLNRYTASAFNALYYERQPGKPIRRFIHYDRYFYPLDFLQDWNRLYGKRGFVQYQCVVPLDGGPQALRKILQLSSAEGRSSMLAVLKRLGPQEGLLAFPMRGWTLTLDFPVKPGLFAFLDRLDQVVVEAGGRVYLAKDARLNPATFAAMYPRHGRWQTVKSGIDPQGLFASALSTRLQMTESQRLAA